MPFEKIVPEWAAAGVEPPESKKQEGWQVSDHPPAAWLNWFFNGVSEALMELQEKAGEVPPASLTEAGIVQLSNATNGTRETVAATEKAVKVAYDEALAGKQLGVERKAEVVAALNSIGVTASTSETWSQLIPKIAAVIRAVGNVTAADILAGKTASNASGPITGSMPNRGAVTLTPGKTAKPIPDGYHNGSGVVPAVSVPADKVLIGTTIAETAGAMPNRSAENFHQPGLELSIFSGDRTFIKPPRGYFDGNSWVAAATPGLTSANLRAGVVVGNITGALQEGKQYYEVNLGNMARYATATVSMPFIPRIVSITFRGGQTDWLVGTMLTTTTPYYPDIDFKYLVIAGYGGSSMALQTASGAGITNTTPMPQVIVLKFNGGDYLPTAYDVNVRAWA
ncbi:tail fiber repeat 2 protein [Paenibacillus algicola]|uniref:Tail fiber repeat 2 protein n=1 Tax=Paenibacillus algicola TaxID=2565926 RepID=A0A4P8XRV4_9BACL|nr:phage tail protein [Paenibacillus algicola]QCT03279.1 tail fiber repeat 2 protein [Paenibacillus algicola]